MTGIEKSKIMYYRLGSGIDSKSHFQPSLLYEFLVPLSDSYCFENKPVLPVYVLVYCEMMSSDNILAFVKEDGTATILLKSSVNKGKDGCFYNVAKNLLYKNLKVFAEISEMNLVTYLVDKEFYLVFKYTISSDQWVLPANEIKLVRPLEVIGREKIDELSKKILKEVAQC
jgi:hypothetical protein